MERGKSASYELGSASQSECQSPEVSAAVKAEDSLLPFLSIIKFQRTRVGILTEYLLRYLIQTNAYCKSILSPRVERARVVFESQKQALTEVDIIFLTAFS